MKKKITAFLCALALLVALLPAGTVTIASAETTQAQYQVGYSIKNINPWVKSTFNLATDLGSAEFLDPTADVEKMIYPSLCSLVGNQVDWKSVIADVFDDNGDGKRNEEDGIFVTCTAVTLGKDTEEEKTVLFFTVDSMKAYDELVNAVRSKVVELYGASHGIKANQIMVSTNHTHSGPQLTTSMGSYIDPQFDDDEEITKLKQDRKNYFNWVVEQMVAAADASLKDRAPATMTRGAVDAKEATAALGLNYGNGYHMNTIRHYEKTVTNANDSDEKISYISSNATPGAGKVNEAMTANGISDFAEGATASDTSDEADNTMYVLRFAFEDVYDKQPIVFVNWRAHSTMNSSVERTSLSSDYANGLRTVLKEMGYRAAFFLGAAGNVVPGPASGVPDRDWLAYVSEEITENNLSADTTVEERKTFVYGKLLAKIAHYCMTTPTCMTDVLPAGEIVCFQTSWIGEKQIYSDEMKAAALAFRLKVEDDMKNDSSLSDEGVTVNDDYISENITKYISDNSSDYFPYRYTDPKTRSVTILNTRLHYTSVHKQAVSTSTTTKVAGIELNAILLGENVAFITSPNELADYFHDFSDVVKEDGTADLLTDAKIEELNDWYNLKTDAYGMPFVLGYSNSNSGYIANWLDFHSNSELFSQITGKGTNGHMIYSPGTYESLTSAFAQGQGEELIKVYDKMLGYISGDGMKYKCQHCDAVKEWTPLFSGDANVDLTTGHYYMLEDLVGTAQKGQQVIGERVKNEDGTYSYPTTENVCLDLNGYVYSSDSRCAIVYKDSTLSIMNLIGVDADGNTVANKCSGKSGRMISQTASNNPGGGAFSIESGATLNLYGGTLEFQKLDNVLDSKGNPVYGVGSGGVASVSGTMNIYGGTVRGGDMVNSTYSERESYNGCGGAIAVNTSGKLYVYDGEIRSGTVPEGGFGPCVYLTSDSSKINLFGKANVEDIFYRKSSTSSLTVSGEYTGTANISFHDDITLSDGKQIGVATENADITGADITISDDGGWGISVEEGKLLLRGYASDTVAMIGSAEYTSLQDAVDAYNTTIIKMVRDEENSVNVTKKDVYLDLNGCSINGSVSTADNYTLYCMDSQTDDFKVADNKYGRITNIVENSNVEGIPEESDLADDGYLKIKETDGVSFHRVDLGLTDITLRAVHNSVCTPSVYYKCNFKGDEKVAAAVDYYGVALSVQKMPDVSNIESAACKFSQITKGFQAGETGNSGNGTLLKGIMKPENTPVANTRYSNMAIYGKAYIHTADGYMMGSGAQRTLKQVAQEADTAWSTLTATQQESMITMYNTYKAIMEKWSLPNLVNAIG